MQFVPGADYVFTFQEIEGAKGCLAPRSAVGVGTKVFYLADDGFYSIGGDGISPIGQERVNQWFNQNSDPARRYLVQGVMDPRGPRIFWSFHSSASATYYDRVLIYDWLLNKWTWAEQSAQWWSQLAQGSIDLDDITASIDSLDYSLDSPLLVGGQPLFGGVDSAGYFAILEGNLLPATIQTPEFHLVSGDQGPIPMMRGFLRGVYPRVDNESATTVTISHRERMQNAWTAKTPVSIARTGWAYMRVSARTCRVQVDIPASGSWTNAQGIDLDATMDGRQ
jgi:hypothetical protein